MSMSISVIDNSTPTQNNGKKYTTTTYICLTALQTFPGQSLSRTDVSRTRRFQDKSFPGQDSSRTSPFPDNHFPGQDVSRKDVSRTRRFPYKTFPGQVILRNFHVHCVNTSSIGLVKYKCDTN